MSKDNPMTGRDVHCESGHYVTTSHRPGGVLLSCRCSFLAPGSLDVVIVKSRRLEVRRFTIDIKANSNNSMMDPDESLFPLILSVPINGRITTLLPFRIPSSKTDLLFFTTDTQKYAVISYANATSDSIFTKAYSHVAPYNIITHVSGDLRDYGISIRGRQAECGPLVAMDPTGTCIALHIFDGFITILPINRSYKMATALSRLSASSSHTLASPALDLISSPFHCRIDESTILSMAFLIPSPIAAKIYYPQLTLLYQDNRGNHSITTHSVDVAHRALILYDSHTNTSMTDQKGGNTLSTPTRQEIFHKNISDAGSGFIVPIPTVEGNNNHDLDDAEKKISTARTGSSKNESGISMDLVSDSDTHKSNTATFSYGGILIIGQREISYMDSDGSSSVKLPMAESYILAQTPVTPFVGKDRMKDPNVRLLLGNELGQLFFLILQRNNRGVASGLHIDHLGTTSISSSLVYLAVGYCFVGSQFGDSQLIKISDRASSSREPQVESEPEQEKNGSQSIEYESTVYISVLEEYTNLGPIVDFDLIPESYDPTAAYAESRQSMMVCASGTGKDGSVRMVRSGVGMWEYAGIELPGIRGMWSIKEKFNDSNDSYIIQSYLGETRMLGVVTDDMPIDGETNSRGNLEEISKPGFDLSKSTLFVGNVAIPDDISPIVVQVTDTDVHLIHTTLGCCLESWSPGPSDGFDSDSMITIATANKFGQIILVLGGGRIIYLTVTSNGTMHKLTFMGSTTLQREVSCVDLESFTTASDPSNKSTAIVVGLWDDFSVKVLSLESSRLFTDIICLNLGQERTDTGQDHTICDVGAQRHRMARSVRLVVLESASSIAPGSIGQDHLSPPTRTVSRSNMLFVGLGDGGLLSFVVEIDSIEDRRWFVHSRKEVSLGTREIGLIPFASSVYGRKSCVLATGDRPTIIYIAGSGNSRNSNTKLCYSAIHVSSDAVNHQPTTSTSKDFIVSFATPFYSSLLFPSATLPDGSHRNSFSLCTSDETTFRIGQIDDIQKLHVTSYKLGMAPRRIAYHQSGRMICVGCIDDGMSQSKGPFGGEVNMGNCVRYFDEKTFEELERLDLEPFEMILSLVSMNLTVYDSESFMNTSHTSGDAEPFIVIGTAYAYPDEDEPTRGRILVLKCTDGVSKLREVSGESCRIKLICDLQVKGGVYSMCPFLNGSMLATVNSKTQFCRLVKTEAEDSQKPIELKFVGAGHHGHILSLIVKGLSPNKHEGMPSQLAIVGDLMRSISVIQYMPKQQSLEEIARDFNLNWTTAIEMLTDNVYIGAENFHNLFVLRRNSRAQSEELRSRLDTTGAFHLGEMPNKFVRGSLVTPMNYSAASSLIDKRRLSNAVPKPIIGSKTLLGTVDGTVGTVLGLDYSTYKFLSALERSMSRNVRCIGELNNDEYRAFRGERSYFPARGFVDGDFVETFLDLDHNSMEAVVRHMNQEGRWEVDQSSEASNIDDESESFKAVKSDFKLSVEDVREVVEELTMMH